MRLWLQVLASSALIYFVLWPFAGPDLHDFIYPWIGQIRSTGLSQPVSNYTPPYIYLLWLGSLLPVSNLAIVKALAILGVVLLTVAVRELLKSFDLPASGVAFVPLLPSVIFNGPFIGQCDAYWAAACVMAVACREKPLVTAAWAGLGFAFKAQAAFIAPYVIAVVVERRAWPAFAIPPLIYLLAVLPAWLLGWPLWNLLTVYVRQEQYFDRLSQAPNLWALLAYPWRDGWGVMLVVAYALTIAAVFIYWRRFPSDPLKAALLSSILVPFVLPKMHERYFFLADILALVWSLREKRPTVFLLVQAGSVLGLAAYATALPFLNVLGSVAIGFALWLLLHERHSAAPAWRRPIEPSHSFD